MADQRRSPTNQSHISLESTYMNETAIEMFSTLGIGVLCIVLGIMVLSIFFSVLNRINNAGSKPDTMAVRGILKKLHFRAFRSCLPSSTIAAAGAECLSSGWSFDFLPELLGVKGTRSRQSWLPPGVRGID